MEQREVDGQVQVLSGLVEYQDGAIVSKILLKQKSGSVTLFAFDDGQSLSEHTVAHDALVQVIDGTAEITISGTPHTLEQGQMIVMPGNRPHAVAAHRRFKMLLTMIRG
jgi:quercetin dioxygenase-like cupin family protein